MGDDVIDAAGFEVIKGRIEFYKTPHGAYILKVINDGKVFINSFNSTAPISFVFDDLLNGAGKIKL